MMIRTSTTLHLTKSHITSSHLLLAGNLHVLPWHLEEHMVNVKREKSTHPQTINNKLTYRLILIYYIRLAVLYTKIIITWSLHDATCSFEWSACSRFQIWKKYIYHILWHVTTSTRIGRNKSTTYGMLLHLPESAEISVSDMACYYKDFYHLW